MIKRYFFITALAAFFLPINAQSQNDFGLWSSVEVKGNITKKFALGLEAQARFDNNVSRFDDGFLSPFAQFDAHKHIRLTTWYRLSSVPYSSTVDNRIWKHRYNIDIDFRKLMDLIVEETRLDLSFRVRVNSEYAIDELLDTYLRGRIKLSYNLPKTKIRPFVASEIFYHFNDQIVYTFEEVKTINTLNKVRFRLGCDFPINKNHGVKAFAMYQTRTAVQRNDFVLGVGYAYNIKKSKSKED